MTTAVYAIGVVGSLVYVWYLYQVGVRAKATLRYKVKRIIVALVAYLMAASALPQRMGPVVGLAFSVLIGLGAASLVKAPNRSRRIPTAIRRAVIERDLISKGGHWDRTKYHIDHKVPHSKGGDNSMRNLHVVEKQVNLRKGAKMPGIRDFLR